MDNVVKKFISGIHSVENPENIKYDASQDSVNFVTDDGDVVLIGGRSFLGTEGTVGKITGLHIGYKIDGTNVIYAKFGTAIKYWDGSTWKNCITGLSENDEYCFANYSSLAGAFTFINGNGGYYKINNSHPASVISLYNATYNFHGKILIDKGRTILWDRNDSGKIDRTGLYGSKIDPQGSNYTLVSGEVLGSSGSTTYTGTLSSVSGTRNCFGIIIASTVTAGTETFTDDYLGVLKSNFGGTGTINYATGVYSVTFSASTTANVTANYQWEDSNAGGLTDFRKSSPRVASEGFVFPQDEGGDAILNVLVGQDGSYYSLKEKSAYRLSISDDDLTATNEVYRKDMGIPFWRCAVSTNKGIMFINSANPTNPEMTILIKNTTDETVEPLVIFPKFDFTKYTFDDSAMSTFDKWILVTCKKSGSINNDTILMCNLSNMTVDVVEYSARMTIKDGNDIYVGDSLTKSVIKIFDGFDDLNSPIYNYWIGKDEMFKTEDLKKIKKLRIKGKISKNQSVSVYVSYDSNNFSKVGTIVGTGEYVDVTDSTTIGSPLIGGIVGGGISNLAYTYYCEIKLKTTKFRKRTIKFIADKIGYFDFNMIYDKDILVFEGRIPKQYRQKQNVSLDGLSTDI